MSERFSPELRKKIVEYFKTDKAKYIDSNTGKRTNKIDTFKLNEFIKNLLKLKTTEHAAKRVSKLKLRYPSK